MQGPTTAVLVRLLCQLKQEIVGIARRTAAPRPKKFVSPWRITLLPAGSRRHDLD